MKRGLANNKSENDFATDVFHPSHMTRPALDDINKSASRSLKRLHNQGILPTITPELERVAAQFAVAITPAMLEIIDQNDPKDPIAAQFIPSQEELRHNPLERDDPIGDKAYSPVEGIVHRYPDRVLLKPLHLCAVYCRFCFRREQIADTGSMLSPRALTVALEYIRNHQEIWEVILSGGDPMMLSDDRLQDLILRLNAIDHVKVIRIHTRIPVVDPHRISQKLTALLKGRATLYVVLHCNHPRELTPPAREAIARLVDAGIPMLSQSVLLKGINDNAETLTELMRSFVELRIKPYHLHHPDLVKGTDHFRVSLKAGQALVKSLRGRLSGLCQPTYLLEIPGGHGKIPVGAAFAKKQDDAWILEDPWGTFHIYHDPADLPEGEQTP